MAGRKPFQKLRDKMTLDQRLKSAEKKQEILTAMFLAEARRTSGMTQQELADKLGIKQPTLSRMENQDSVNVATLSRIVQALGGTLEVVAHLPAGDVRLTQSD